MFLLIMGLSLFMSVHFLPVISSLRQNIIHRTGASLYKILFSILSASGFVMIVMGKAGAAYVEIWNPPSFLVLAPKILMLPAMIFLVAAYIPSSIKYFIRHPMLIAVKLWALSHLMVNGDLASILLFGTFLIYAVIDMISANRRSAWLKPEKTSLPMTLLVVVLGMTSYALIAYYHGWLFGVALF